MYAFERPVFVIDVYTRRLFTRLGLITGVAFGALLQQGRVLRFEKQVGAMLLKDMTIMKFMLSAILVGMVGINLLAAFGLVKLSPKATVLGANIVGGILFGGGWAIMGFCPGTSVGAVAEGRVHAVFAILGMLAGAAFVVLTLVGIWFRGPGMSLVGSVTTNITLKRYNVLLRPGSGRMMSATADATHFGGCKGTISLEDCTFEGMGDDAYFLGCSTPFGPTFGHVDALRTGPDIAPKFTASSIAASKKGGCRIPAGKRMSLSDGL